jgi:DNA invertase Pin-like site-specific DNA recombinase
MGEPEQKLVAYTRVSTRQQGVSGLGLEAQDAAIAAYVKTTGATLIAAYTEIEVWQGRHASPARRGTRALSRHGRAARDRQA